MDIVDLIKTNLLGDLDPNLLILRILLALGLVIIGLIFGNLINFGLKKLFKKIELEKKIRIGILDLFRAIVRWSVYIIFLGLGLTQLGTTNLTQSIMSVLIIVPTFMGALIIIIIGFSIAHFLKRIIKESGINGVGILSEFVFYFVIYLSGVYALKIALVSMGEQVTNYLIMILTAVFGIVGAYLFIKKNQAQ